MFACKIKKNIVKYYQPYATKGQPFLKGGKEGYILNNADLILHLVEELIAEKEKNIRLQQGQQQMQSDNAKTNMQQYIVGQSGSCTCSVFLK